MVSWSIGSVADEVFRRVDNIPSSISGASLLNIVDQQRVHMENFTGLSVGSVGISERFQGVLTDLSCAALQKLIDIQGSDKGFRLGDFTVDAPSITSGKGESMMEAAEKKLRTELGRRNPFYRTYG